MQRQVKNDQSETMQAEIADSKTRTPDMEVPNPLHAEVNTEMEELNHNNGQSEKMQADIADIKARALDMEAPAPLTQMCIVKRRSFPTLLTRW